MIDRQSRQHGCKIALAFCANQFVGIRRFLQVSIATEKETNAFACEKFFFDANAALATLRREGNCERMVRHRIRKKAAQLLVRRRTGVEWGGVSE